MKRLYEADAYTPDWPESHWRRSLPAPTPAPRLTGQATAEVAVIGAGYAGLSAAHELVMRFGADVAVLDAVQPGWGASGRNGGFCCLGGSKLSDRAIARRVGAAGARAFDAFQRAAIEGVADFLETHAIDARQGPEGETYLAHSPAAYRALAEAAQADPSARLIAPGALAEAGRSGPAFHGALQVAHGFPLHPLAYVEGLARVAAATGVRIHGDSPVLHLAPEAGGWRLDTPEGSLRARRLVVATNGYSSEDLPPWLAGRTMPVASSVIVTRPLSAAEQQAQGWTSDLMAYDSRNLLHYFRLMPDGRFLFGMRGGTHARPGDEARIRRLIRHDFDAMFPAWAGVEAPYFWSGLVNLSRGLTPYVGPIPGMEGAFTAMAWHGNGVAMATYGGALLADLVQGKPPAGPFPEVLKRPLGRFPLGLKRRAILDASYRWYGLTDMF